MRIRLTIEYDGTPFRGWAEQPGQPTVEAAVRAALEETFASVRTLAVAGRTDAGVHALGNVVTADVEGGPPPERAAAALNTRLPDAISVVAAEAAAPDFHARHSALARSYRYRIFTRASPSPFERRRSLAITRPLDIDRLAAAAAQLPGEHDFRAFTRTQSQHHAFVRVVESAEWIRRGDHLEFEITANSYLRHMVRTLVGTMLDEIDLAPLLDGGRRADAGRTAPPWGLYLVAVRYPGRRG
jgi:tRNA pseudouridine38-40 synthase